LLAVRAPDFGLPVLTDHDWIHHLPHLILVENARLSIAKES
jgi:hypothetical protein